MRETSAWFWQLLGSLVGAATLVSLIKNGFAIELHGLPAAILRQYTWLRDGLFEPLVWVFRYFGLSLAWWLKDILTAYVLVTAAHWRALRSFIFEAGTLYQQVPERRTLWQNATMIAHSIVWPYRLTPFRATPPSLLALLQTRSDVRLNFKVQFLRHLIFNLLVVVFTAVAFFVWSYLSNVYGPS